MNSSRLEMFALIAAAAVVVVPMIAALLKPRDPVVITQTAPAGGWDFGTALVNAAADIIPAALD